MSGSNTYPEHLKSILKDIIDEMAWYPWLFAKNPDHDFKRNRKLPFDELLWTMINMGGEKLKDELFNRFGKGDVTGHDRLMSSSAFIQQRDKLIPSTMEYIFHEFNERCKDSLTYRGYRLCAVDGTSISIYKDKNEDSNIKVNKDGSGNQLHANMIYDICEKTFDDCIIQPRSKAHERDAFLTMLNRRKTNEDTIYIMDRGYEALAMFETIHRTPNSEYIIRVQNSLIKEIRALPYQDLDVDISFELRTTETKEDRGLFKANKAQYISGPSKFGKKKKELRWPYESPFQMTLRVVRKKIGDTGDDNRDYKTYVTSLDRFQFPADEICKLYHMRWEEETAFRDLKHTIGLINFHSRNEEYICQEIYANLIAYNFCARVAINIQFAQKDGWKYEYKVEFASIVKTTRDFLGSRDPHAPPHFEERIRKNLTPIRPGRSDERKVRLQVPSPFLYRIA